MKKIHKGSKSVITNLKKKTHFLFQKNQALSSKYKCNIKNINLSKNQIIDMQENLIGEKLIMIQEFFGFSWEQCYFHWISYGQFLDLR